MSAEGITADAMLARMSRSLLPATLATLLLIACGPEATPPTPTSADFEGKAHPALVAHSEEFERRVYRVTDRVHVAVGFGLANSILIEGDDGVVIVDVMGTVEAAREVRAAFEEITPKPIVALVYTHNHADHVFGGTGFVADGQVDVYAHDTTNYYINRVVNVIRPIISVRSARMFGGLLPRGPDGLVNAGIGPFLEIGGEAATLGLIRPNRTFDDELALEIAGVKLELVHAPGETNDQLFVWLPDERVLLPGDNIYKAFPNLYTIRGTLYRDVLEWAHSLDRMRALEPEHLVPSHTRPLSGRDDVHEVLTAYRDAIQFVHDQTIRGMNRGLTPDELVEAIRLPAHLRDHAWLQELYGTVEWSVRSIFTGYLGWFDGDAATLSPASPDERAAGYVALAGGPQALLEAARGALEDGRPGFAAELATHAERANRSLAEAREIKAEALRELGRRSISPNGRNYYLSQALELEGGASSGAELDEGVLSLAYSIPIRNFVEAMPVNLDPLESAELEIVAAFRFRDVDESYTIEIRRGVAEFRSGFPENPDLAITTDSQTWREIVLGQRSAAVALASDDVEIEGGVFEVVRFLGLFR